LTLRELARAAQVSPTTASLALNDHPRVAVKTRQRIAETAARLGFVHNVNYAARRMAHARFRRHSASFDQVGFIYLADVETDLDPVCLQMMRGAEHELSRVRASLVFVRAGQRDEWDKVQRLAQTGIVDAWLIVGAVTDHVLNRLKQMRLPCVILGDQRCSQPVHVVDIDFVGAGRMAAEHLASLGHRRIAFVTGVGMPFEYQRESLEGFRAGVREHQLDDDERLIAHDPFARDLAPDGLRAWLRELGEPPTAIFCTEPSKMDFILRPLREAGIEIPRQMSLLSCEVASAQTSSSGLTRIEMPMAEVGRQGAMLLHKIVTEARVASCQIKLTPTLVEGWSTCPLSSP